MIHHLFSTALLFASFSAQAAPSKISPPSTGAYHGAYADFGEDEDQVSVERISKFSQLAGKNLAWAYFSNHWLDGVIKFPAQAVETCRKAGVVPYIRLHPWSEMTQYQADPVFKMQYFIDGKFDAPLREWAREARDSRVPMMLEFGPEVNGYWFPWNGKWNGGSRTDKYGDPTIPDGPERFRDAYRHVIRLFREEGADNVTWVLHVDAQWDPEANWNLMKWYYPGDEYIDWIGVSAFGAQLPTHDWIRFPALLKRFWPQIEDSSKRAPILISEYGVIEKKGDRNAKAEWIHEALQSISRGQFPRIKGVTYWNSIGWKKDGSASFKIDTSRESLEAYRSEIASPFWLDRVDF